MVMSCIRWCLVRKVTLVRERPRRARAVLRTAHCTIWRMRAPWIVTLVCGASGTGKSCLARPLAERYGVPLAEADDIVTALQAITTREQQPVLHFWQTHPQFR